MRCALLLIFFRHGDAAVIDYLFAPTLAPYSAYADTIRLLFDAATLPLLMICFSYCHALHVIFLPSLIRAAALHAALLLLGAMPIHAAAITLMPPPPLTRYTPRHAATLIDDTPDYAMRERCICYMRRDVAYMPRRRAAGTLLLY